MDKITKLSQAIRLGSTFRPQAQRVLYHHGNQTSCALGAAAEAVGIIDWDNWIDEPIGPFPETTAAAQGALEKRFPELLSKGVRLGLDEFWKSSDLLTTIVHLNDVAHWSREQIATWLEDKGL